MVDLRGASAASDSANRVMLAKAPRRQGRRELNHPRSVHGAHSRTVEGIRRALAVLAASLLGIPLAGTAAGEPTPHFSNAFAFLQYGPADVGSDSAPAFVDIDGDGDLDAFIGQDIGNTIFLENTGTASSPVLASPVTNPFGLADAGFESAPALADIDNDGDLDAFIGTSSGNTTFFENTGTAASPSFASPVTNPFGLADVGDDSVPAFADIDGDGDLDAFIGEDLGKTIFFENTGTASFPAFASPVINPFGLAVIGFSSAPAFADIDDDGDLDALIGEHAGNTNFFENTGTASSPAFSSPLTDPFGLADVGSSSVPAFADIDDDGDFDLLIGTFSGHTFVFENTGTATSPTFASALGNPFGLSEVDFRSRPALADIDGDGDLDAFIGQETGNTLFFENIGTAFSPAFASPVTNPFGLPHVAADSAPAFADIDGDGDLDAFIGASSGYTFSCKNAGTASSPAFASPSINAYGLAAVGGDSAPAFADIDGDGDLDALIGESSGNTILFKNLGTASSPAFANPLTNPFGLAGVGSDSAPAFVDIDGDGDLDALFGASSGSTFFFEKRRTAPVPVFAPRSSNPFGLFNMGYRSAPAFADIDGDGDLDALIGTGEGKTWFFENVPEDIVPRCPRAPALGCADFAKGSLLVDERKPGKEKILIKLARGPALAQNDLGNPLASGGTSYDLCLYDDQPEFIVRIEVDRAGDACAGKPCWKPIGAPPPAGRGYFYKDPDAAADGISMLKLKAGDAGKSGLMIKGQNNASQDERSLPLQVARQLSPSTSVTVQLLTSDAGCFSKTLSIVRQSARVVQAK